MSNRNRNRMIVLAAFVILAAVLVIVLNTASSKADGPPDETVATDPAVTDPCFRQDIECYDQTEVECDDNVFVPLNADGTWTCPGEQLPEERIGRAIDCPNGQVGYVTDVEGHILCLPPADQVERGGSHPFFNAAAILEVIFRLFFSDAGN